MESSREESQVEGVDSCNPILFRSGDDGDVNDSSSQSQDMDLIVC